MFGRERENPSIDPVSYNLKLKIFLEGSKYFDYTKKKIQLYIFILYMLVI